MSADRLIQIAIARADLWLCAAWGYLKLALCGLATGALLWGVTRRENDDDMG